MAMSPRLLACMSVAPSSRKPVNMKIEMEFRYPFSWEVVSEYVIKRKMLGPPDTHVSLEVDGNTFHYSVAMPWYARFLMGPAILWDDVVELDREEKILRETGQNISLQDRGCVKDFSVWRASAADPGLTLYEKEVDLSIRMPVGPAVVMKVAEPLINWFKRKSNETRLLEVEAIRAALAVQGSGSNASAGAQAAAVAAAHRPPSGPGRGDIVAGA